MVGARRSPANGGKRPSEATLLLSSPSKMRKGTGPREKDTNSESSKMGTGSREKDANSESSKMGTGSKERGANAELSEIRSIGTTMARPHLPPTFGIRLQVTQNAELKIVASHISNTKTECSDIGKEIGENTGPHKLNAPKLKNSDEKEESQGATDVSNTNTECSDIGKEIGENTGPHKLNAQKLKNSDEKEQSQGATDGYHANGMNAEMAGSSRPSHSGRNSDGAQTECQQNGSLHPPGAVKNCDEKEEKQGASDGYHNNDVGNGRNVEKAATSRPSHSERNSDGGQPQCLQNGSLHPRGTVVLLPREACTPESWLHLPPLAVWQVWRSLSTDSDRARMRLVSNEWYNELPMLVAPRPWIVGSGMVDGTIHSIQKNKLQELKLKSKVPDGCFCGSCLDFIISEAKIGWSLWNPSDGTVMHLPLKSYTKIVMVATPDLLAFAHSPGKLTLSFGRPAQQSSWKSITCGDKSIQDICQCGMEFYAVSGMFRLYRLDQESGTMVVIGPQERSEDIRKKLPDGRNPDHILLADLNEKLLVIALGRNLQSVQVFKVEWLDDHTTTLVSIDDLDGWSIFLGTNQSIALNAQDFPGIEGNRLYIALEPVLDLPQTIQVYSLQAKTVAHAEYPSEKLGTPFFYHPGCFSTCE